MHAYAKAMDDGMRIFRIYQDFRDDAYINDIDMASNILTSPDNPLSAVSYI